MVATTRDLCAFPTFYHACITCIEKPSHSNARPSRAAHYCWSALVCSAIIPAMTFLEGWVLEWKNAFHCLRVKTPGLRGAFTRTLFIRHENRIAQQMPNSMLQNCRHQWMSLNGCPWRDIQRTMWLSVVGWPQIVPRWPSHRTALSPWTSRSWYNNSTCLD